MPKYIVVIQKTIEVISDDMISAERKVRRSRNFPRDAEIVHIGKKIGG